MNITFQQDPSAVLDYMVDWSGWLGTDTISSTSWTVPVGITQGATSNTTTTATSWFYGGSNGSNYTITNTIVTAGGRTDARTFKILVRTQ